MQRFEMLVKKTRSKTHLKQNVETRGFSGWSL